MAEFTLTGVKVNTGNAGLVAVTEAAGVGFGTIITTDGKLTDCTDANLLQVAGVVLQATALGDQAPILDIRGLFTVTNTLTPGRILVLGTAGQVKYDDELITADNTVHVGLAKSASQVQMRFWVAGVLIP